MCKKATFLAFEEALAPNDFYGRAKNFPRAMTIFSFFYDNLSLACLGLVLKDNQINVDLMVQSSPYFRLFSNQF